MSDLFFYHWHIAVNFYPNSVNLEQVMCNMLHSAFSGLFAYVLLGIQKIVYFRLPNLPCFFLPPSVLFYEILLDFPVQTYYFSTIPIKTL